MGPSTTRIRGCSSNTHVEWIPWARRNPPELPCFLERSSGDFLSLQEASNCVTGLCSASHPIFDAVSVQLDFRRLLQRIIGPYDLYGPAIAGFAFIENYNPVERLLFLAKPSQTNC